MHAITSEHSRMPRGCAAFLQVCGGCGVRRCGRGVHRQAPATSHPLHPGSSSSRGTRSGRHSSGQPQSQQPWRAAAGWARHHQHDPQQVAQQGRSRGGDSSTRSSGGSTTAGSSSGTVSGGGVAAHAAAEQAAQPQSCWHQPLEEQQPGAWQPWQPRHCLPAKAAERGTGCTEGRPSREQPPWRCCSSAEPQVE